MNVDCHPATALTADKAVVSAQHEVVHELT